MSIIGAPAEWVALIDSMIPQILPLVISTWEKMDMPASDAREDDITSALCRELRDNRTVRQLPFQVDTQVVELEPEAEQELGRLDLAFRPLLPREDIYFCLECKRLNVLYKGKILSLAPEYVNFGMMRFVTGQYARAVRHGGMLGYVLDGKIAQAMTNVERNIRKHDFELRMTRPGKFLNSSILPDDSHVKETRHKRPHNAKTFQIHHIFVARI